MKPYIMIFRTRLSDGRSLAAYRPYQEGRSWEREGWKTQVSLCHNRQAAELACRIMNAKL